MKTRPRPSQFLHLTGVGVSASHRHPTWQSVRGLLAEAAREPNASSHIARPRPPRRLLGVDPLTLEPVARANAQRAVDAKGRKLRRDAVVLYAIVISYPVRRSELRDEVERGIYEKWQRETLAWLQERFGVHLHSVVEHVDEAYLHLHAFVLPPLDAMNRVNHSLHPGYAARNKARSCGADHRTGERAYRDGMRSFQDDFNSAVSARFSHERVGPRRQRFRRDMVLARRAVGEAIALATALSQRLMSEIHDPNHDLVLAPELQRLESLLRACEGAQDRLLAGKPDALNELRSLLGEEGGAHEAPYPLANTGSGMDEPDDDLRPEDFGQEIEPGEDDLHPQEGDGLEWDDPTWTEAQEWPDDDTDYHADADRGV